MFWFAIGLACIVVVYGVLYLCFYSRSHWRTVFKCRMVYCLMRFLSLACISLLLSFLLLFLFFSSPYSPFLLFCFFSIFDSVLDMGLLMTCSYTLVAKPHDYQTIVPAFFTLVIVNFISFSHSLSPLLS